eukprot:6200525-Pleurochrysis_carterae.AAC.2
MLSFSLALPNAALRFRTCRLRRPRRYGARSACTSASSSASSSCASDRARLIPKQRLSAARPNSSRKRLGGSRERVGRETRSEGAHRGSELRLGGGGCSSGRGVARTRGRAGGMAVGRVGP